MTTDLNKADTARLALLKAGYSGSFVFDFRFQAAADDLGNTVGMPRAAFERIVASGAVRNIPGTLRYVVAK